MVTSTNSSHSLRSCNLHQRDYWQAYMERTSQSASPTRSWSPRDLDMQLSLQIPEIFCTRPKDTMPHLVSPACLTEPLLPGSTIGPRTEPGLSLHRGSRYKEHLVSSHIWFAFRSRIHTSPFCHVQNHMPFTYEKSTGKWKIWTFGEDGRNIRVRGLPESIDFSQLSQSVIAIFNDLLGRPPVTPIITERLHRALCPRGRDTDPLRDAVCCLIDFPLKEEILHKNRSPII